MEAMRQSRGLPAPVWPNWNISPASIPSRLGTTTWRVVLFPVTFRMAKSPVFFLT